MALLSLQGKGRHCHVYHLKHSFSHGIPHIVFAEPRNSFSVYFHPNHLNQITFDVLQSQSISLVLLELILPVQ